MSLIFNLLLIAIAWLIASLINGLPEFWHIFSVMPLWLMGLLVASIVAWFVSDP